MFANLEAGHVDGTEEKAPASPAPIDNTRSPSPVVQGLWLPKPSAPSAESRKLTGFRTENTSGATRQDFEKQQPITRLILKTSKMESSSPAPPGIGHPVFHPTSTGASHQRRSRPETSHQKAVNQNRKMRIDNILHKRLVTLHRGLRRRKRLETSTSVYNALSRIIDLPEDYDTDAERAWGPGGLVPNPGEESDYGGEALVHKKVVERAQRRLVRAGAADSMLRAGGNPQIRRRKSDMNNARDEVYGMSLSRADGKGGEDHVMRRVRRNGNDVGEDEPLDDLDLDLLGEGRGEEQAEDDSMEDSGMDESEDGDDNSEDGMMDGR